MTPLRRGDAPEEWARLVALDDEAIITQVDDGAIDKGLRPTSSSSAPSVMAKMIDALKLRPGMGVLEIGAGTGYNAAIMAAITGVDVTTVEVDPDVASHARLAVERGGYPVTVITGDGRDGCSDRAPYDRVIATVGIADVPYAWVEQTRSGGLILMPWRNDLEQGGRMLTLTKQGDGSAVGKFGQGLSFMHLRQQRPSRFVSWVSDHEDGRYDQTITQVNPSEVLDGGAYDAKFAIGLMLANFTDGYTRNEDGSHTFRLSHYESGSWAGFTPSDTGEHLVRQHGPRRLWDELESAYHWWIESGRPGPTRFGLTVTPMGQRIWLDEPDNLVDPAPGT
ncbi:rRNA adenine N-6-methyltransferase family protein [Actinomadura vinacea]